MRIEPTSLPGVMLVVLAPHVDERGSFARTFDRELFAAHDLATTVEQTSVSRTSRRGTLRGMHYQAAPWEESKLVRVVRGAIWDVVVDLRPTSPTYLAHFGVELAADGDRQLYVPAGCAHGFLTLTDDVEVCYQMSVPFHPEAARGVRFDDPVLAIDWPFAPSLVHPRDRGYPDLVPDGTGSAVR